MGKIKKILENELVGGTQSTDVYPITSVKAVYDENNERLDNIINKIEFDVSLHNDGAVFESLSALLSSSNLNTLIPTSVRHGGMSIRFIQGSVPSSDNKYVQYRLMSTSFSTKKADWQGVDDEPTAGSDNLVKSGEVFKSIGNTNIMSLMQNYVLEKCALTLSNGYYGANNVFQNDSSWRNSDLISIGNDIFLARIYGYNNVQVLAPVLFYDSNETFISANGIEWFEYNSVERIFIISKYNVPANASYFRLCGSLNKSGVYTTGMKLYKINKNKELQGLLDITEKVNISSTPINTHLQNNYYIEANTGIIKSNSSYFVTDKIPILQEYVGSVIEIKYSSYNTNIYSIYNSNDVQLFYKVGSTGVLRIEITQEMIDAGASYIRACSYKSYSSDFYIKRFLVDNLSEASKQFVSFDYLHYTISQLQNIIVEDILSGDNFPVIQNNFSYDTVQGYLSGDDGVINSPTSLNWNTTSKIPIQLGDIFLISIYAYNINEYTIFDSNDNVVTYKKIGYETVVFDNDKLEITQDIISKGGTYLRVSGQANSGKTIKVLKYVKSDIYDYTLNFQEQINDLREDKKIQIVCDGDSLTNGQYGDGVTYATYITEKLQNIDLDNTYQFINFGSPGDNTLMIMSRMGVISLVSKTDITIPAALNSETDFFYPKFDYEGKVSGDVSIWPNYFVSYCNPVYINGIKCNLIGGSLVNGRYQYKLKRLEAGIETTIKAGTPLITKCAKYINDFHIVFMGMNGGFKTGSGSSDITPDDVEEYVNQCNLIDCQLKGNCIFLTPHIITGGYNYTSDDLETSMSNRFGNRYINLRKYFSNTQCLLDARYYGILPEDFEPTQQDITDISNGICPTTLRYIDPNQSWNVIHFNSYGYALLGQVILNRLLSLGIIM